MQILTLAWATEQQFGGTQGVAADAGNDDASSHRQL